MQSGGTNPKSCSLFLQPSRYFDSFDSFDFFNIFDFLRSSLRVFAVVSINALLRSS